MTKLHRTDDWARLSNTILFDVVDQPGEIIMRQPARDFRLARNTLIIMWIITILPFLFPNAIALFLIELPMIPLTLTGTIGTAWFVLTQVSEVRFLPDRLAFYTLLGRLRCEIGRDGMQQILVEPGIGKSFRHRFIADTAYWTAFTEPRQNRAILKNNILMAAYNQPVALDLAPTNSTASVAPMLHVAPVAR